MTVTTPGSCMQRSGVGYVGICFDSFAFSNPISKRTHMASNVVTGRDSILPECSAYSLHALDCGNYAACVAICTRNKLDDSLMCRATTFRTSETASRAIEIVASYICGPRMQRRIPQKPTRLTTAPLVTEEPSSTSQSLNTEMSVPIAPKYGRSSLSPVEVASPVTPRQTTRLPLRHCPPTSSMHPTTLTNRTCHHSFQLYTARRVCGVPVHRAGGRRSRQGR
ncbi:uncharacterized protein EV422DRAFT_537087 [Fimicolochytrium jonesii]|uniref:uncharacterized protein n=1 Tax=Fimicolochytrium jonesii TaxID=1396493 RepID=UPI0022FECEF2|nr:uncharacterized protein EV422DRAFT_537087 [Fimicolochytrium jonesii]KAI8818475.1 hypothetical protein EV422DRAFT_537087 [Fimicolochytrium jonesii]